MEYVCYCGLEAIAEMKVSDNEAFKAAQTLHNYCLQYHLNRGCKGCMFIITDKRAVMKGCCRLDFPVEEWEFRGAWNRRARHESE